MKKKHWLFLVCTLLVATSCSSDETPDIRKAFLGTWQFDYELACSPGSTVTESEELVITKGSGSSKMILTFEGGLILECAAYSENIFGVSAYDYGGTSYTLTGSTYPDGSLDILITFSVGDSYCVQSGAASKP